MYFDYMLSLSADSIQLGPLHPGHMRRLQGDFGFLWSLQHGSRHLGSISTSASHLEPSNDAPEEVGYHGFVRTGSNVSKTPAVRKDYSDTQRQNRSH